MWKWQVGVHGLGETDEVHGVRPRSADGRYAPPIRPIILETCDVCETREVVTSNTKTCMRIFR